MNFAVVRITSDISLQDIVNTIKNSPEKTSVVEATINEEKYNVNLKVRLSSLDGFKIGHTEHLLIDGNSINITGVNIYTERAKRTNVWLDENNNFKENRQLVNPFQADFIFFEYNGSLYALGSAGVNRVKALLKDAFNLQSENIEIQYSKINEDILYWIFKRFIDTPNVSLLDDEPLIINSLESYVGKTRDNVNAMRGEGDGISVILGTLAFLFNNEELKSIRPTIQYGNEKILIEIGLTGTFKLWENSYRGRAFKAFTGIKKEMVLALYVHLVILPILVKSYKEQLSNSTWSNQLKMDFIKRLGERITQQVNNVLQKMDEKSVSKVDEGNGKDNDDFENDLDDPRELIDDEDIIPSFDEDNLDDSVDE